LASAPSNMERKSTEVAPAGIAEKGRGVVAQTIELDVKNDFNLAHELKEKKKSANVAS